MEELANPSYIRIYPNITTSTAFNYFSLFHALALLNIPEWKIDIPTPEQNFEYNLAYGLFKLDDCSKEFEKYGYYICNQHDWAMKHLKEELTEKKINRCNDIYKEQTWNPCSKFALCLYI